MTHISVMIKMNEAVLLPPLRFIQASLLNALFDNIHFGTHSFVCYLSIFFLFNVCTIYLDSGILSCRFIPLETNAFNIIGYEVSGEKAPNALFRRGKNDIVQANNGQFDIIVFFSLQK